MSKRIVVVLGLLLYTLAAMGSPIESGTQAAVRQALADAVRSSRLTMVLPDRRLIDIKGRIEHKDGFKRFVASEGGRDIVSLVETGGEVFGWISKDGETYRVVRSKIERIDASNLPRGNDLVVPAEVVAPSVPSSLAGQAAAAESGNRLPIQVYLVLAPDIVDELGENGARALAIAHVDAFNSTMIDSGVEGEAEVVGFGYYDPGLGTIEDALTPLQNNARVASEREEFGADVVSLMSTYRPGGEACGIAYIGTPNSTIEESAKFAYSIFGRNCEPTVFAHELGHNLAARHDRANDSGTGPYPYGYGYSCGPMGRTVMAYPSAGPTTVGVFSNPEIFVDGSPCGVAEGQPDAAHNAKVVGLMFDRLTSYKSTPQAFGHVTFAGPPSLELPDSDTMLVLELTRDGSLDGTASVEFALVPMGDRPALEGPQFQSYVERVRFDSGVATISVPIELGPDPGNARTIGAVLRYPVGLTLDDDTAVSIKRGEFPPPSVHVGLSQQRVLVLDNPTLSWNVEDASDCLASGAWDGNVSFEGTRSLALEPGVYEFVLSCSGEGGISEANAVLTVVAQPTVTLTIDRSSTFVGEPLTISWTTTDAEHCIADGDWSGEKATSGSESLVFDSAGPKGFGLGCTNVDDRGSGGAVVTSEVFARPVEVTLSIRPNRIDVGGKATVTWDSIGADDCTASGEWQGSRDTAGTAEITGSAPGDYTYNLICNGLGGTQSRTSTLSVKSSETSDGGSGGSFSLQLCLYLLTTLVVRKRWMTLLR